MHNGLDCVQTLEKKGGWFLEREAFVSTWKESVGV